LAADGIRPATGHLSVEDIDLDYGAARVLRGVSIEAPVGKVTTVLGRNGVGKTSLLRAIIGHHPVTKGTIRWDGEDISRLSPDARARRGLAIVPQGREIFPLLTVTENLETAFACLPRDERHIPERIYELFPVLKEMENRRGGDLSGGQQQQLAIARALVTRPRVLLLDEPTEGIQPNIIQQIGRVIERLRAEGDMAIVLVEQFFDFAFGLADRLVAMSRGAVTLSEVKANVTRDEMIARVSI
jgi:urea transport system ATP-binding protein